MNTRLSAEIKKLHMQVTLAEAQQDTLQTNISTPLINCFILFYFHYNIKAFIKKLLYYNLTSLYRQLFTSKPKVYVPFKFNFI